MDLRISIALCTYNGAVFIEDQIRSFFIQTRLPDELIVCDDGSKDATLEIVQQLASQAPFPIKVYKNEQNLNVNKNFERAIGLCEGDLIFLSDQDDVWMQDKVERILAWFDANPWAEAVFTDAVVTDQNLSPLEGSLWDKVGFTPLLRQEWREGKIIDLLINCNLATGATMCIKPSLYHQALPFPGQDTSILHDGWLALVAACRQSVGFLEDKLLSYRQHSAQHTGLSGSTGGLPSLWAKLQQQPEKRIKNLIVRQKKYTFLFEQLTQKTELPPHQKDHLQRTVAHFSLRHQLLKKPWWQRFGGIVREIVNKGYASNNLHPLLAVLGDIFSSKIK